MGGLFPGNFLGDVAVLALGSVIAQVLNLAAIPILARLYSPADFGQFSVLLAVLGIAATAITWRYEIAILLPKMGAMSDALQQLSLLLAVAMGVVLFTVAWFIPDKVKHWLGVDVLGYWFEAAVLLSIAGAVNATAANSLSKQGKYLRLACLRVIQSTVMVLMSLSLGVMGIASGLLWAQAISMILIGVALLCGAVQLRSLKFRRVTVAAYRYRDTPKYLLPAALLDVATLQMPVVLIAAWFGGELAGQFGMAWRLMALPTSFVGMAVGQVFFQRFSAGWPCVDSSRRLLFNTWKILFAVGIVPTGLVMSFGPEIFSWVLGGEWRKAGEVAAVIAPMIFGMFVSSPTSMAFLVMGLQRYSLRFGMAFILYRSACLYVGYVLDDLLRGLLLWVFCELITIFIFNKIILLKLKENEVH